MFLENCKECKKKVSNDAKFCPKCGVPAPTTKFSIEHPKCIIEDCYEYGQTHGKKFKGQLGCKKTDQLMTKLGNFVLTFAMISRSFVT